MTLHNTIAHNLGTGLQGGFNAGDRMAVLNRIISGTEVAALPNGGHLPINCLLKDLGLANVTAFEYLLDSGGTCQEGFGLVIIAGPLLQPRRVRSTFRTLQISMAPATLARSKSSPKPCLAMASKTEPAARPAP